MTALERLERAVRVLLLGWESERHRFVSDAELARLELERRMTALRSAVDDIAAAFGRALLPAVKQATEALAAFGRAGPTIPSEPRSIAALRGLTFDELEREVDAALLERHLPPLPLICACTWADTWDGRLRRIPAIGCPVCEPPS